MATFGGLGPQGWCETGSNYTITGSTLIANTATNCVWQQWIVSGATTSVSTTSWGIWSNQVIARKETKRQKATREKREREEAERHHQAQLETRRKAAEAEQRAEQLLVEHLSEAQRQTLEKRNYFDVVIEKRTYRIHRGTHGNVRLLDEEGKREKTLYCVQPPGVPAADAMLAQKLHLEANEQYFLTVANSRAL